MEIKSNTPSSLMGEEASDSCSHQYVTNSPEGYQVCEVCGVILDSTNISNITPFVTDTRVPKQPKSTNKRDLRSREDISAHQLKRSLTCINTPLQLPLNIIEQCLEITTSYMTRTNKPLGPMGRLHLALGFIYLKCKVTGVPLTLAQLSHYSQVPPMRIIQSHQELLTHFPNLHSSIVSPVVFFERLLFSLSLPAYGMVREMATELFGLCEHLSTGRKPESLAFALILVALECQEQQRFSVQQLQERCQQAQVPYNSVYERFREVKKHLMDISKLPFAVSKETLHLYLKQLIQLAQIYPGNGTSLPPAFLQAQLGTRDKEERIDRARRRLLMPQNAIEIEDETDLFIEELLHQGLSDTDILNYLT